MTCPRCHAEKWVVGNYKETDLTHVRPGQPATITVDTYPGVVFRGRVDSIQAGSCASSPCCLQKTRPTTS